MVNIHALALEIIIKFPYVCTPKSVCVTFVRERHGTDHVSFSINYSNGGCFYAYKDIWVAIIHSFGCKGLTG